jgi:hypothetical protein
LLMQALFWAQIEVLIVWLSLGELLSGVWEDRGQFQCSSWMAIS